MIICALTILIKRKRKRKKNLNNLNKINVNIISVIRTGGRVNGREAVVLLLFLLLFSILFICVFYIFSSRIEINWILFKLVSWQFFVVVVVVVVK